jgi:hypothetical protein
MPYHYPRASGDRRIFRDDFLNLGMTIGGGGSPVGEPPPIVIPAKKKAKKRKLLDPMDGMKPEFLEYVEAFEQSKLASSSKGHTPESNAARSETLRRYWADPENKRRHLEARKGSYDTPEFKEKISRIGKQRWAESTEEFKERQRAYLNRARDIRYGKVSR